MNVKLNYEQSARLELIALHAGKSTAQVLVDAAQFLLDRDAADAGRSGPVAFLSDAELEARLGRVLRR